jgi:hypothetical protein
MHPDKTTALLRREGEYWTIAFNGPVFRLRDCKGLTYLAYLLRHPGERFAVGVLASIASPGVPPGNPERARSAVSKRIREALRRITTYDPALGHYLSSTVRTGRECVYVPAPHPLRWDVQ